MAINKDSNAYTIIFAIAMCVVVGTSLVIVSQTLKPVQEKNVMNDKKQNILAAIQVEATLQDAGTKFEQYVKDAVILDANSQAVEVKTDVIAEALTINALSEFKDKPATDRRYPLFICEKDGSRFFVMPVGGQGLWAGVWGY
ncbi:MAG TPA: NADH:ubiquinone reductase (Na(+)-transporting) subunit C, partial [Flavobacteriales bacterium]|nr:NADH:ubiquinone reductase (Na(+)-transporting) subunit C [Flavobacteriales bacterium]